VLTTRKNAIAPAGKWERRWRYGAGASIVLGLGFAFAAISSGPSLDADDTDASPPASETPPSTKSNIWQSFAVAVLFLLPAVLLGIRGGFYVDSKRTPRQRVDDSLDTDERHDRPDLVPVGDSNVPALALNCIFNEGFAEGCRQDFIDLLVRKHGRPPANMSGWLSNVFLDQDLRECMYGMVIANASVMVEDDEFIFMHGLVSHAQDQTWNREVRTMARKAPRRENE
jgi:hypothetical protein